MKRASLIAESVSASSGDDVRQTLSRIEQHLERIERRLSDLEVEGDGSRVSDFLSVDAFARRVHRAPWTIRNACRLGHIRAVRSKNGVGVGGRWRIPATELARILAAGQVAHSNAPLKQFEQ